MAFKAIDSRLEAVLSLDSSVVESLPTLLQGTEKVIVSLVHNLRISFIKQFW